jgi:cytochrome c oxidase subunit 4
MAHHAHEPQVTVLPPDKAKIKKLWTVALYLLVITVIEFIIAFTVPHEYKQLRVWVFVGLTIVKAAYIVGEFMHLRYEVKVLFWSILIPSSSSFGCWWHLYTRELKCRYFNNDL